MAYKNCQICKQNLDPTGKWVKGYKYCSEECFKKAQKLRQKKNYVKRFTPKIMICEECGNEFKQKSWNHTKFCGLDCSKIYHKRLYYKMQGDNIIHSYLKLRFEIFKRDNFTCQYCGRTSKIDKCKLMVDHIIPKSKGGKLIPTNLITSCEECNLGKKDILLENRQLNKIGVKNYVK